MTELAALLSAAIPQPGAVAQGAIAVAMGTGAGPIGTPAPADADSLAERPRTAPRAPLAIAFQAALAAQAQAQPGPAPAPIAPIASSPRPAPSFASEAPRPAPTRTPDPLLPVPLPVGSPAAVPAPVAPGRVAASDFIAGFAPASPPVGLSTTPIRSGKLPNSGNILPVLPPLPGTGKARDGQTHNARAEDPVDEKSTGPAGTADPAIQPLPGLLTAVVESSPPIPASVAAPVPSGPTGAPSTAVTTVPAPRRPITVAQAPMATNLNAVAATRDVPGAPAVIGPTVASAAAPVADWPRVPAVALPMTGPPAVNQQAVVMALAVPSLAPPVRTILPPTSPTNTTRLARQLPAPHNTGSTAPVSGDNAAPPAAGSVPSIAIPAPVATRAPVPVAHAPQDFATLVDRLVEARSAAQAATPPQQISTSVTHADFGKVSLTFQQDGAGLSVSMASADPGFARAAQSAIVTAVDSGALRSAPASHLASAQPDAPAAASPVATTQSAGFSATGGGSEQSPPQPHTQPQQRAHFIARANPSQAATPTSAATATSHGIFA